MIQIKRAYDPISSDDGSRFLVDRLWPRGISREKLHLQAWLKEIAPSDNLRRSYGHNPSRWKEFERLYTHELEAKPEICHTLLDAVLKGSITLIYSAQDTEHNNAVALKKYLERELKK